MRNLTQSLSAVIVAGLILSALASAGRALVSLASHAEQASLVLAAAAAPQGRFASIAVLIASHTREVRDGARVDPGQ